jgi:hypothetical protein
MNMSSRLKIYQAKAEMCRRQADIRGSTPAGARWLKLSQQWLEMAEQCMQADQTSEHAGASHQRPPPLALILDQKVASPGSS